MSNLDQKMCSLEEAAFKMFDFSEILEQKRNKILQGIVNGENANFNSLRKKIINNIESDTYKKFGFQANLEQIEENILVQIFEKSQFKLTIERYGNTTATKLMFEYKNDYDKKQ